MVSKTFFTLALATGFAAAKPINAPQSLPAYPISKRQIGAIQNGFGGEGFNFIDGFNRFNDQQQVLQIKEQNIQIQDNGRQQAVVQQVKEVLVVNQQQNGFNRDMNNLFRKANFRNQGQKNNEATVMLVVQQIQVSVADDRGNAFEQDVFVQSALVANRGARVTNTVMVFESQALIATQVLGNRGSGFGGIAGVGNVPATNAAQLPTKTADLQLFGARPTWSVVAEDPAATLGAVWQAELEDLQKVEQDQADNQVNNDAAQKEKEALDQAGQEQQQQGAEASQSADASQSAEVTSTAAAAEATPAAE
ncbi:hypothetical protein SLS60_008061 [Paraconiothyrium brasiliense]|uniref:Curli production assembly/transport component CsgF n=1 Tax=Paraconiothyrium brasiliense TaxID=300254 RepID=A0ABR3R3C3_9PLEO